MRFDLVWIYVVSLVSGWLALSPERQGGDTVVEGAAAGRRRGAAAGLLTPPTLAIGSTVIELVKDLALDKMSLGI